MSTETEIDQTPAIDTTNSRRLFRLGCAALVAGAAFAWWRSPLTDYLQLAMGITILVLGCIPGLLWARNSRPWFPCFEISMLTGVVFYAVPLLSLSDGLRIYPAPILETSALLVIGYMLTALVMFNMITAPRKAPGWAVEKLLPDSVHRYLPLGLVINTTYLFLDRFTDIIPPASQGTVRALCFALGIVTSFILACEWGRARLGVEMKLFFTLCLVVQIVILFSHLYLIKGISLLALSAIGYTTTKRRLPWIPLLLILPVLAVLHNGKSTMRDIYWDKKTPLPSLGELPVFFSQWTASGLQTTAADERESLTLKLADRASLFQMIAMSVDQVPSLRPHLNGESYIDIPAQVIPRFLWPDKPSSLLSNVRLAVYFNLVDPDNPFTTSIAFGIISESYVNFGITGVLLMGAVFGLAFKQIALRSVHTPLFSPIGIFMILLTAWSFQAEQVLATWLTSLFQASVMSIGVPLAWKKLFGAP